MADVITAVNSGAKFLPHPEGQYALCCVDTIALGERVESFPGSTPRVVAKCAIVFWSAERNPETGDLHDVSAEFTVSMNEKAGLRILLEAWRGKSYTEEQVREGVPLHKLVGQWALASIEHKKSASGRTYAKIKAIAPLPKGMPRPELVLDDYERPKFWEERKKQYATEVAAFRGKQVQHGDEFEDFDHHGQADDDLPF